MGLTKVIKSKAKSLGADLVGVCSIESMGLSQEQLSELYPGVESVIVLAYRHSAGALEASETMRNAGSLFVDSKYTRLNRYDVLHVYHSLDRIAHDLVRFIEDNGFASVAVSGWLPVDWGEGKRGLVADFDLRKAAIEAGLGNMGKNNILITKEYGPRIRLGGVLTSAKLEQDKKIKDDPCIPGCTMCMESCPGHAIKEGEKTDIVKCGEHVFQFGLRALVYYIREQLKKPKEDVLKTFFDTTFMNLWQTLNIGVYYTCFECQRVCPVGTWNGGLIGSGIRNQQQSIKGRPKSTELKKAEAK